MCASSTVPVGLCLATKALPCAKEAEAYLAGTPKVVVDLHEVDYIDSGGLGILVGLWVSARNKGGELKLASPTQRIKELLRRTSLAEIFRVYGNNDEAVAPFRKTGIE